MMRYVLCLAILSSAVGILPAAELNLILKGGQYFLVGSDSAGNVITRKITVQIMNLDGATPPPVDPPPVTPPSSDPLAVLKTHINDATSAVAQSEPTKSNTKLALGKLYRTVSTLPVTSRAQLNQATDLIFVNLSLPQPWQAWKAVVDQNTNQFAALDDARRAWQIVADSLEGK